MHVKQTRVIENFRDRIQESFEGNVLYFRLHALLIMCICYFFFFFSIVRIVGKSDRFRDRRYIESLLVKYL